MNRTALAALSLAGVLASAACGGGETALPPNEALDASREALRQIDSVLMRTEITTIHEGATETTYTEIGYEQDEMMFTRHGIKDASPGDEFTDALLIPDDYYLRTVGGDWYVISPWNQGERFAELPEAGTDDAIGFYDDEVAPYLDDLVRADDERIDGEQFLRYDGAFASPEGKGQATLWLHKDSYLPRRVRLQASDNEYDFDVVVEFIDYDLPVLLPIPPEARPYRDYELAGETPCAGEELELCLETQHELDDTAAHSCEGQGRRVCLLALGQVDAGLMRSLVDYYRDRYGLPISVIQPTFVPADMVDHQRGQLRAWELMDYSRIRGAQSFFGPEIVLIGITPVDIFNEYSHYSWVFGVKTAPEEPLAVISTFRMQPEIYGDPPDDELFQTRVRKMVSRYIGVLYYELPESPDPQSPLFNSIGGLADLDVMSEAPIAPELP